MIRLIRQIVFKMSSPGNFSGMDLTKFDIPADGLKNEVSRILQIPYLSKYEGSKEELSGKVTYSGKIIGNNYKRFFFSIPTALKNSQEYYYVHYLLYTGSPITTLTHQALCCLHGKKADDQNVHFSEQNYCYIGSELVQTYVSNPKPTEDNPRLNYRNANVLGMNFLRKYSEFKLGGSGKKQEIILQLIPFK